jgi:general secretion pathway protein E
VLATLHTNDSVSAVTRLTDMGVEPFLLSSSLLGVLAQRLVRKLCPVCAGRADNGEGAPVGCDACGQTGYQGRTGIFELLVADDAVQSLIHSRAPESQIFTAAERGGLRSMREDGERLVRAGISSRAELLRVTRD